jgi:hypothetical protein
MAGSAASAGECPFIARADNLWGLPRPPTGLETGRSGGPAARREDRDGSEGRVRDQA